MDHTKYKDVVVIHKSEVRAEYTRGTGNGGQHKNVTDSCVTLTHYVTGIKCRVDGRNKHKNESDAFKEITKRVNEFYKTGKINEEIEIRRGQIGKGNRNDKRRTYIRLKDGYVIDHITGKRAKLKSILRGNLELLH